MYEKTQDIIILFVYMAMYNLHFIVHLSALNMGIRIISLTKIEHIIIEDM